MKAVKLCKRFLCHKCEAWLLDTEEKPASLCPRCNDVECVNVVRQLYRVKKKEGEG